MKAVILDIDGTLLDSSAIDNRLYMSAVGKVLGRVKLRSDWTTYTNVTDTGLLQEIMADNGQNPEEGVIEEIRQLFFEKMRTHLTRNGPFPEIPGALSFVERLATAPDSVIAYATGGWRISALMKLESAGFPIKAIPLSSSDEFPDRRSIMENAVRQMDGPFESITYVGDGLWDEVAARALGWVFLAVGEKLGGINSFDEIVGVA